MAVLVTGAAGFIGSHVCRALIARGEDVVGIDNLDPYYAVTLKRDRLADIQHPRLNFIAADFADHAALEAALKDVAIDRIVHLGAQAGVRHSIDAPRAYGRANLVGHLNLLEIARARQVRHLVYASSSSVYGGSEATPFQVEARADRPVSLYAATKRANELMSESYAHLYRLPQTGLRFFTVYGRWGRPDMAVWRFTERILRGEPIPIYNAGHMRRDFTHVDDVNAGVLAALDRPPADDGQPKPGGSENPHAIYNLGNDRPEELATLIDLIEAACGRHAIRDLKPMQPGDVIETAADITESVRDLGYRPRTTIADGVPDFVSWYRDYTRA